MNSKELEKRIQIMLPQDQLEDIVYHSSYQPQDPSLLKRNKEYLYWGHLIIIAAYSLYLYQHEMNISEGELSSRIAANHKSFENRIFMKYNLEDFVIKSNGEINQLHPDIATKLIVLIYQQYGFIKVYEFLLPFFDNSENETEKDYKTLIQEYAQAKRLSPIYEVINISGPDHEKVYTCKVTIGKMAATASAIGKKRAEKETAKQFVLQYNIQTHKKEAKHTEKRHIRTISVERKRELDTTLKIMQLSENYISHSQMDKVLIHRSYANEQRHQDCYCNACISIVGANVLSMLCFEYILENYDLSHVNIKKELGVLLQEDNLAKSIPDESIKYLLKSAKSENEKSRIRYKIDVFKSVIGTLWENYVLKNNNEIAGFVKNYAYSAVTASAREKILDYRSFLQEVTQTFNWTFANECKIKSYNADNSTVYISIITVKGSTWEESGSGAGGSKAAATNAAAKDILASLVYHCTENRTVEAEILRMLDPEILCAYEKKHIKNSELPHTCNDNNVVVKEKQTYVCPIIKEKPKTKPILSEEIPKEVSFDCAENVLYVCKGTTYCRKQGHEIVSSTGILSSLNDRPIKININYCKSCKLCFISLNEYKCYKNTYGVLLGNISISQTSENSGYGYEGLADESILHICGYTVNQADGLSSEERRKILGNLMDHNIISKYRIIEYLQFFINSNKYRYNMRTANKKWSEDLEWVRNYNIDNQKKYVISDVIKWK